MFYCISDIKYELFDKGDMTIQPCLSRFTRIYVKTNGIDY